MVPVSRVARKEHHCTLCGLPIFAGDKYQYARITPWDHEENEGFSNYCAHVVCDLYWAEIGSDYDWQFPAGYEAEFRQDMESWLVVRAEQNANGLAKLACSVSVGAPEKEADPK